MSEDELDDRLKELPAPPIDELFAERVRRRAQATLAQSKLERVFTRVMLPSLVTAACVVYFVWAVEFASRLYR